jgi:TRAP-type C4-dicarboxylate transport system substrate-binding protein
MKIISTKPGPSALIQKWGGSPVEIQIPDYYMSLERGVVDGVLLNLHGTLSFGLAPLVKQYVSFENQGGLCVDNAFYTISENAWGKMTPETQKIFMEEADKINAMDREIVANNVRKVTEILEKANALTVLTTEQVAEFSKDAPEYHKAKIAELEKKGIAAQKVYDAIKKAAAEMKK